MASGETDGDPGCGQTPGDVISRTVRVQTNVDAFGYGWSSPEEVFPKVREELFELKAAMEVGEQGRIKSELGDLIFATINLCRYLGVDPTEALRESCGSFERRFDRVRQLLDERGVSFEQCSPDELDVYWEEAKRVLGR